MRAAIIITSVFISNAAIIMVVIAFTEASPTLRSDSREKLNAAYRAASQACYLNGYWHGRLVEARSPNTILQDPVNIPSECRK